MGRREQELTALISKAIDNQRHEVVTSGFGNVRNAFGMNMPGMASRSGWMSVNAICEIHDAMVKEVEESLASKFGYFCSVFYRWRVEVMIIRSERETNKHMETKKDEWDKLCEEQRAKYAGDAEEMARHALLKDKKWRQATALMLDQWAHGEREGLWDRVFRCWSMLVDEMKKYRSQEQRLQKVANVGHGMVLKWIEGDDKGCVHTCLLSWIHLLEVAKAERETKRQMEALLSDEQKAHSELLEDHRTEIERQRDQHRAAVGYALARWELGDDAALASKLFAAWGELCRQLKRLAKQRQAVHMALLKSVEGDIRGSMHECFLSWVAWKKREFQVREGESRLADQHRRWEQLLEDTSNSHDDELNDMMTAAQRRLARAHEATYLMLRQWLKGEAVGLITSVFSEWKTYLEALHSNRRQRQAVHAGVLKFLEGDSLAAAHMCLLNWKQYTKVQIVYKRDVAERNRAISKLQDSASNILGSAQTRSLKYTRMLCAGDDDSLMLLILHRWHIEASGVQGVEDKRRLELKLQEAHRLNEMAKSKHKHLIAASFNALGLKNSKATEMDFFEAWKYYCQNKKQIWAHKMTHSKTVEKFAKYTLNQFLEKDAHSLLAAVLWEWIREHHMSMHEREREEARKAHKDAEVTVVDLDQERGDLQYDLEMALKEIERLRKNLKGEREMKESLENELEQVHCDVRGGSNGKPRSRPAS